MAKNKYIVTRDGFKVSENEYPSETEAFDEFNYWEKLTKRWDKDSLVKIVPKKKKKVS